MSKVRNSGCASLEWPRADTPCPRSEKPHQDGMVLERQLRGT